ncbi:MAG: GNAT family N-acetyltransferase [Bacteroidetes bacterium]|nr:GNAT family N-acetyltransferase [Bacteroidota bacterium]
MKFPNFQKVILFGGSLTLIGLAEWLIKEGISIRIYTSARHALEPLDSKGTTLAQKLDNLKLSYIETEDINTEPGLIDEITNTTIGIGIGEAWSFSERIIEAFDGRLLDYMGIPLPRYRGGAHYTWMILQNDRKSGCNLQEINTEMIQGVFDSGKIVKTNSFEFPETAKVPADYFNTEVKQAIAFIKEFLVEVKNGNEFTLNEIDESKSLYLPRLNTMKQGWIDWSWEGFEIEQFIRAFDEPYKGASTRVNGKRIFLKNVILDNFEEVFHPFQSGLVTRVSVKDGVFVATTSGLLCIKNICDENGESVLVSIKPGMRLYTPAEDIDNALTFEANYGTSGLLNDDKKEVSEYEIVRGNKISLRPITIDDCTQDYVNWLNNPKVNNALETRFEKQTINSIREFVVNMQQSDNSHLFAIILNKTNQHVGNIKVGPVNFNHMFGDISYFIGDPEFWNKGLATEAVYLITRFAFQYLQLHKCMAGVYASNKGSCHVLEKVGYNKEGRIVNQYKGIDGWEDHILYGMLSEEFKEPNEQ